MSYNHKTIEANGERFGKRDNIFAWGNDAEGSFYSLCTFPYPSEAGLISDIRRNGTNDIAAHSKNVGWKLLFADGLG